MSSDQISTKDKIKQALLEEAKKTAPHIMAEALFNKLFNHHTISDPMSTFSNDDFPLLRADKVLFKSGQNQLTGYFYHYQKPDKSKVVIFVHGFGNGHHRYFDLIDYLAKNGLYVFSYDATSFDESEGNGIRGFPQGLIDLSNAINYVKSLGYKEEDISLVGHSWGAYSSGAITIDYPHIAKVVMISGFNKSLDLIKSHGSAWARSKFDDSYGYIVSYEKRHFPQYSSYTVLNAFKNSQSEYLIIHSEDDKTVPIEAGLALFKEELKGNHRVSFITLKDRGHGTSYDSAKGRAYYEDLTNRYKEYLKDKEYTRDEREHLFNLLNDKSRWTDMLNYPLMDSIVDFIKRY